MNTSKNVWVPLQRLSKDRKEIFEILLYRLGKKVETDHNKLIESINFNGEIIDIRKLYINKDENSKMTFTFDAFGRHNTRHQVTYFLYITYEGPKINIDGVSCFTYKINDFCNGIRLSEDNRLYLPIHKVNVKNFIESDRIYIDEFINY